MERQPDAGMAFEQFQERQVAVLVGLLDDAVEIADGLVVVEDKDEPNGRRHKGNQKRCAGRGGAGGGAGGEDA